MSEELALAIVATRGSSNNLFQIATLVRAATTIDATVDVLFRDDALVKLRQDHVNVEEWSPMYRAVEGSLRERLRAAEFDTMETFLKDAKEHGDNVRYWACRESLDQVGLQLIDLVASVDGSVAEADFLSQKTDALLLQF